MSKAPAADRTLRLFEAFRSDPRPLTLSRLAAVMDIPISSCHGIVATLIERGYMFSLESQKALYPTRKLWEVASVIAEHDPVVPRLLPMLDFLCSQTGETVIVGKRQGAQVLYLAVLESSHTIRYVAHPGDLKPVHSSAIGKALLSTLADADLEKWLKSAKLTKMTDSTITSKSALKADLTAGARRGYFVTDGENVADVLAIAAPVRMGNETLAIAVAGPRHRMRSNRSVVSELLTRSIAELLAA